MTVTAAGLNFGWGSYEYGDGGGSWTSLGDSVWQHLDFGWRGPPVMADGLSPPKYLFDIG